MSLTNIFIGIQNVFDSWLDDLSVYKSLRIKVILSDFFSFTKKIIYYFCVVFTGGNKQYFVERIAYSSRLVNDSKMHLCIKDILKFMLGRFFICFVT